MVPYLVSSWFKDRNKPNRRFAEVDEGQIISV